jgi:hypothetical protein
MADRVDENGAAYAGSQLQTQLYVNERTAQLDDAIVAAFPDLASASLEWRSPLAADSYREYWDAAFLRCLGLDDHVDALARFWPSGGPHWDALALVRLPDDDAPGVLLVEGKSYPNEMLKGSGTTAADGSASRTLIEKSLAWTQGCVGIPMNTAAWTGTLYQNANRLAHAHWLRSRGVRAWLVHLLFTGDPHGPTTDEEWEKAVAKADEGLGLGDVEVPLAAHVLLPAGTREELLGAPE